MTHNYSKFIHNFENLLFQLFFQIITVKLGDCKNGHKWHTGNSGKYVTWKNIHAKLGKNSFYLKRFWDWLNWFWYFLLYRVHCPLPLVSSSSSCPVNRQPWFQAITYLHCQSCQQTWNVLKNVHGWSFNDYKQKNYFHWHRTSKWKYIMLAL